MVLRRVAVTGASGMVGRHLLTRLADEGVEVSASSRSPAPPGLRADWGSWDLRQWMTPDDLDDLFGQVDAIFHVGAAVPGPSHVYSDADMLAANVSGCRCLGLWAMARGIPLLFLSGGIVYGPVAGPIDEGRPRTSTPEGGYYGLSKVLAEQVLENMVPAGLRLTILRASSIYGWGLGGGKMIPAFLARAGAGETLRLAPPTDDRINLIHAADVAAGMTAAARADARGAFNLAAPAATTVLDLARACVAVTGRGAVEVEPGAAGRAASDRFPLDCTRAARTFGFAAAVDLDQGLRLLQGGRCR